MPRNQNKTASSRKELVTSRKPSAKRPNDGQKKRTHSSPASLPPVQHGSSGAKSSTATSAWSTPPAANKSNPSSPSPAESSPLGWRSWPELTVRLDDLPEDITTQMLYASIESQGHIERIEIFQENRGSKSAKLRFKPPPLRQFWMNPVLLSHSDKRKYPHDIAVTGSLVMPTLAPRSQSSSKMVVALEQLDFGNLTGPTSMAVMKSVSLLSASDPLKLELDFKKKQLVVYFSVPAKVNHWTGSRRFCLRANISHINKIYQTDAGQGTVAWILPLARPPQYFWEMDDIYSTFSLESQTWGTKDLWYRATHIAQDLDVTWGHPVSVHNDIDDPGYIEIGCWTTFRFVFSSGPIPRDDQRKLRKALEDLNVSLELCLQFQVQEGADAMWQCLDRSPPTVGGAASALLDMTTPSVVDLAFEVRYQLEVCLSRGLVNENTISTEFLEHLARLKPFDATRRLEYLADRDEPMYDLMQLFTDPEVTSYIPNLGVPHYCTLARKAAVTPTSIRFSSPTIETSNRVMRRYKYLQDRFLRVQFIEEMEQGRIAFNDHQNDQIWKRMLRTLYCGIRIGDRTYEFLGFGNSQLRDCGAYFFCPTEHVSCDDIRQWMGSFSHIRVVAKYAARMGQCFSTTREIRGIVKPQVRRIPDVERNNYYFTDGVGMISPFLARVIIDEWRLDVFDEPTAFQFRMGGCKGVLAVWPQAKGLEVLVRKSQEKFQTESNGLEIIRCAKYSTATLNRQTIPILESLGVPVSAFVDLLDEQIQAYQHAMEDNTAAINLLTKFVDTSSSTVILAELLDAGFKTEHVQEPFVLNMLNLWQAWSLKLLKDKSRIQISKSAFVIGTVDETGTLRGHSVATEGSSKKDVDKLPQIFLQLTERNGQTTIVEGICAVGRNPSLHPGDIRVVEAVDRVELHGLKDVVVFPSTGDRPVANMLSGGDLDGDDFFVIWDPSLIPREWNFGPMNYTPPTPKELSRDVNVDDVRNFFVNYLKSDVLGLIASAHVAHADRKGPKSSICLLLADLHSKAVDFPKTGEPADFGSRLKPKLWPHFMEKRSKYHSKKALGVIYDKIFKHTIHFRPDWKHAFDQRILSRFELGQDEMEAARNIKKQYDISIRRILSQREVATEFELYTTWAMSGPPIGSDYKRQEQLGLEYESLKWRYRDLCVNAAGAKDGEKLEIFVAAMYTITEEEFKATLAKYSGRDTKKAGRNSPATPLISFPWIFPAVLVKIAKGSDYEAKKSFLAAARHDIHGMGSVTASAPATGGEATPPPVLVTEGVVDPAEPSTAAASIVNVELCGDGGLVQDVAVKCDEEATKRSKQDDGELTASLFNNKSETEAEEDEEGALGGDSALDRLAAVLGYSGDDEAEGENGWA